MTFCGSEKARRYDISPGLRSDEIVGELDLCDVEMFFDGNEDEKTALLGTESGLEALFVGTVFSCEQVCQRPLDCGHHSCTALCHPGDCPPCPFLPSQCLTCPCGRVPLSKLVRHLKCSLKVVPLTTILKITVYYTVSVGLGVSSNR